MHLPPSLLPSLQLPLIWSLVPHPISLVACSDLPFPTQLTTNGCHTLLSGVKKLRSCRLLRVKVWLHTHLCWLCFVNWTQVRVICEEGASFQKMPPSECLWASLWYMPPSECLWASLWYIFFIDGCGKVWATVGHRHPWTGGLELKKKAVWASHGEQASQLLSLIYISEPTRRS